MCLVTYHMKFAFLWHKVNYFKTQKLSLVIMLICLTCNNHFKTKINLL